MTQSKPKRRYVAPKIETSDPFERLALGCNGTLSRVPKGAAPSCTTTAAS